ncbi:hypothetical protein [Nostoc sp.]
MDWLERVAKIRKTCNVPAPPRNVAIARVWVEIDLYFKSSMSLAS